MVAHVAAVGVPVPEGLGADGVGRVIVYAGQRRAAGVHSRQEGCDDLEGGAWLPLDIRCPVQGTVGCLFSPASADGLYISGGLLNQDKGSLWLESDCEGFSDDLVILLQKP